ncbi:MAG: phosphonate C-P lyase system protein PhnG [Deltaproteobacteria bacterium]|jgi:alpha-D-ribose 1-methylphosphonate 5-triphosphate synthase subunit PhnG|nr:phosphonate C-P lyase system protein PhnG [Deltaproteobacteria bacterium]
MDLELNARRLRVDALSLATREDLEEAIAAFAPLPPFSYLREPESGIVMVRARVGGTGKLFNLGEILISRCVVEARGKLGFGFAAEDDLKSAELAALLDCFGEIASLADKLEAVLRALKAKRERRLEAESRKIAKTQVEFFTLARGDDEPL